MFELKMPIKPTAKARPVFVAGTTRHSKGRCYTPDKTIKAENDIASFVKMHMIITKAPMLNGPLSLYIEFGFKLPKNISKSERELVKNKQLHHVKKPDLDNMVKLVSDALNGILYEDDKQVVHLEAYKIYDDEEYVKIKVQSVL